jgi:glutamyl-tRNA reductase
MIYVLNANAKTEADESFKMLAPYGLSLETCLRKMVILTEDKFNSLNQDINKDKRYSKAFEVRSGFSAIEYLVKVLSGLESPVLGETEVLGQFKKQVVPQLDEKTELAEVVQFVLNLVKMVRSKHLVGLGSQSYGSLVRRILKAEQHVLFVGSGLLAESIFPWVKDTKKNMFAVRSVDKFEGTDLFKSNPDLKTFSLIEDFSFDFPLNVIVCAPIESTKLEAFLKTAKVNKVIDLREESKTDPIQNLKCELFDLQEVFSEMSAQAGKKESLIRAVNKDINIKLEEKFVKHRPFGWEDLCL